MAMRDTPVMLPPGRARLVTMPDLRGSPVTATMGIYTTDLALLRLSGKGPSSSANQSNKLASPHVTSSHRNLRTSEKISTLRAHRMLEVLPAYVSCGVMCGRRPCGQVGENKLRRRPLSIQLALSAGL